MQRLSQTFQLLIGTSMAVTSVALIGCGDRSELTEAKAGTVSTNAEAVPVSIAVNEPAVGMPTLEKAAGADKYAFLFFFKTDDKQTQAMRTLFDTTLKELSDRADAAVVDMSNPAEHEIVEKYGLDRAPMPLVLAVAPSGAITGGFPTSFTEQDLKDAFATEREAECLKDLQAGKLLFLCLQNDKTASNKEAMQGVQDFQADPQFAGRVSVVKLDPTDSLEKPFLQRLQLPNEIKTAMTVFLVPPGAAIAQIEGETSKDMLTAALKQATSSCCPGGSCQPPDATSDPSATAPQKNAPETTPSSEGQ